ncbi:hypothetical protein FOPG_10740 [Fusarium oxysporum f. sp. conglutinans race 2 54008]|uniref:Uncharacterized protein n=3 Tax=Fusarium oxysporum TaxID=5507 RepID=X0HD79_FUSOX|nr:hypothetical protein FOPG_10740 [Fusarium oxysporum f. sp. conglutinans race 2 54008]KAG6994338.1 hypothetical protein FocnCong_v016604 [Fusarium oxysporum f. sp. conglutinans]KAG7411768.1 hypothetical protein Forpi1262_v017313 [Fusarium oxysporum f. sp. raphani]
MTPSSPRRTKYRRSLPTHPHQTQIAENRVKSSTMVLRYLRCFRTPIVESRRSMTNANPTRPYHAAPIQYESYDISCSKKEELLPVSLPVLLAELLARTSANVDQSRKTVDHDFEPEEPRTDYQEVTIYACKSITNYEMVDDQYQKQEIRRLEPGIIHSRSSSQLRAFWQHQQSEQHYRQSLAAPSARTDGAIDKIQSK